MLPLKILSKYQFLNLSKRRKNVQVRGNHITLRLITLGFEISCEEWCVRHFSGVWVDKTLVLLLFYFDKVWCTNISIVIKWQQLLNTQGMSVLKHSIT